MEIHVCCHVCIITITPIICVNVVDNVAFLLTSPYNLCISEEICLNGIGLYKVMNEHVWPEDPNAVVCQEAMPDGATLDWVTGSRALDVTSPY